MTHVTSLLFILFVMTSLALGADEVGTPADESPDPNYEERKATEQKVKGRRLRDKEAEGTQAPDRFEADTVIKSQYQYNGEHLEVDPD